MKKLWLFFLKVVEDADEVWECAEMKNPSPQKGDLNPRPSERERERERERVEALGCVLALRKLFFLTKQKTQNPTRTYKENEPYGSKLSLAGN